MGAVTFGIPTELAVALRDGLGYRTFIETGTFKGGTAAWAARNFDLVYTIEAYRPRYEKTLTHWMGQFNNLKFSFGDSREVLPWLLSMKVDDPALFWLDAHWMGDRELSQVNGMECSIREELEAINNHPRAADHAILIDDARLFTVTPAPFDPRQWPRARELYDILESVGGRQVVTWNDVIIAVPVRGLSIIGRICQMGVKS